MTVAPRAYPTVRGRHRIRLTGPLSSLPHIRRRQAGQTRSLTLLTTRIMLPEDITRLAELDRSEHITGVYVLRRGGLEVSPADVQVPDWFATGDGPHCVARKIIEWRPLLSRGGTMLGSFDAELLAGPCHIHPEPPPRGGSARCTSREQAVPGTGRWKNARGRSHWEGPS